MIVELTIEKFLCAVGNGDRDTNASAVARACKILMNRGCREMRKDFETYCSGGQGVQGSFVCIIASQCEDETTKLKLTQTTK
jgi:hypothetical protein